MNTMSKNPANMFERLVPGHSKCHRRIEDLPTGVELFAAGRSEAGREQLMQNTAGMRESKQNGNGRKRTCASTDR